MAGYLLDTNILSEVRKGAEHADREVWQWWAGCENAPLFVSVLTFGEIRKGIERLRSRDTAQALVLDRWVAVTIAGFQDRILDVDSAVAERWGRLQAIRPLPDIDALLAASALHHDLTLVTRNEADFEGLGVRVFNPFGK